MLWMLNQLRQQGATTIMCIPPCLMSQGLAMLRSLQELWLGRNRIAEIGQGLEMLSASLRRLSLQSNRLVSLTGLEACTALVEL